MEFAAAYTKFWQELGPARKMVLATALAEKVTARMMSVVVLEKKLYFQTDITFRKYQQIRSNPHVALCADNIQIEGYCQEEGIPACHAAFSSAFQAHFPGSYQRYSALQHERVFSVTPTFIERWLYIDGKPHIEPLPSKAHYTACWNMALTGDTPHIGLSRGKTSRRAQNMRPARKKAKAESYAPTLRS